MPDLNALPYPIARLYHEMELENDPGKKFRALIRTFIGFLKYLSLMAVSEYLHADTHDPKIDRLLTGTTLSKPSLGHWNHFLRDILGHFRKTPFELKITGILDFYYKSDTREAQQTRNVSLINDFINLRNEYIHPDIWLDDDMSQSMNSKHIAPLDKLIEAAGFLREHRLILAAENELLICSGYEIAGFRSESPQPGLSPGTFYIRTETETRSLFTFLLYGDPENTSMDKKLDDIFLYESQTKTKIKFLRGNYLRYLEQGQFQKTSQVLGELKERLGEDEQKAYKDLKVANVKNPDWNVLKNICNGSSRKMVQYRIHERKYHKSFYLPREQIESHYWNFLKGPERIIHFAGHSGCGKTNLLCHLTEESMKEKQNHCVLHFFGRNYSGGGFSKIIANNLIPEENDIIAFLRQVGTCKEIKSGKKIVLFIDAINEFSEPGDLYGAIKEMAEELNKKGIDFFKMVVSCRTAAWKKIESQAKGFSKDLVYYAKETDEKLKQPFVNLGPFTAHETEFAYENYVPDRNSNHFDPELLEHFNIKLETPFKALPLSIRKVISNPIFMRMLVNSVKRIGEDLTASDILLMYYEKNVPFKHRYFLHYLVKALWDKKEDFLSETDFERFSTLATLDKEDYRKKLADYFGEDPVDSALPRYQCTDPACRLFGISKHRDETIKGNCRECECVTSPMAAISQPVHSTFFYLTDEGIISVFESTSKEEGEIIRFTYDRFFELVMARYLLRMVTREKNIEKMIKQLLKWLENTNGVSVYDNVFVQLLVLLFDQTTVDDKNDRKGLLFKLEKQAPDQDKYLKIVIGLLQNPGARTIFITGTALRQIGASEIKQNDIEPVLLNLCNLSKRKKLPLDLRMAYARVSLETASALGLLEPLLSMGQHKNSNFRMLATVQSYFLWKMDEETGLNLIKEGFKRMFYAPGIPKPSMLEFVIGTAIIILLGHPKQEKTVAALLSMGREMVNKMRWILGPVTAVLPAFIENILKDVPSDYNPVNLTELRLDKKEFLRDEALRKTALEYIQFLREETTDRKRQREITSRFMREWPKGNFAIIIHQLVQGKSLQENVDRTIETEVEIAREALQQNQEHWFGAMCYNLSWLNTGDANMSDQTFASALGVWKTLYEGKHYRHYCLADTPYYNWVMSGMGLDLVKRYGSYRHEFLEKNIDCLFSQNEKEGIYALFRGLDILGPELGTGDPRTVRLTLTIMEYILRTQNELPDCYLEKLAGTLTRMKVIFPEDVEVFMSELGGSPIALRLETMMRNITPKENIGVWLSQRGQVFYLYAMGELYWRDFFADILENFVSSKSLSANLRYIIRKALNELKKPE